MYKIHLAPLVTIPQGQIAYVFARDGQPLEPTQTLGRDRARGQQLPELRVASCKTAASAGRSGG